jgi:hypothetical protein
MRERPQIAREIVDAAITQAVREARDAARQIAGVTRERVVLAPQLGGGMIHDGGDLLHFLRRGLLARFELFLAALLDLARGIARRVGRFLAHLARFVARARMAAGSGGRAAVAGFLGARHVCSSSACVPTGKQSMCL